MESLTALLWSLGPLSGVVTLVLLIAALIVSFRRARRARVPAPVPEPAPPESDAEELDSSHIGFAPLVGSGAQQASRDAGAPTRGEDGGGTHR